MALNVLVVAKFSESTDWTRDLPAGWQAMIVCKDRDLPNEGREPSSYYWAMQILCSDPPETVAFVQGSPFDHCPELFDELQEPCDGFRWLGNTGYLSDKSGCPHHPGLAVEQMHREWTGREWPGDIRFAAGGQFIIPGMLLKRRTVAEYAALQKSVEYGFNPWCAERLWQEVMG